MRQQNSVEQLENCLYELDLHGFAIVDQEGIIFVLGEDGESTPVNATALGDYLIDLIASNTKINNEKFQRIISSKRLTT